MIEYVQLQRNKQLSANAQALQDRLRQQLKTRVTLHPTRNDSGRLEIHYGKSVVGLKESPNAAFRQSLGDKWWDN